MFWPIYIDNIQHSSNFYDYFCNLFPSCWPVCLLFLLFPLRFRLCSGSIQTCRTRSRRFSSSSTAAPGPRRTLPVGTPAAAEGSPSTPWWKVMKMTTGSSKRFVPRTSQFPPVERRLWFGPGENRSHVYKSFIRSGRFCHVSKFSFQEIGAQI